MVTKYIIQGRHKVKVKDLRDWYTVNNMYNKGVPIKQIARELGIARNTVKKLIKQEEEPRYSRKVTYTKIDAYKDKIRVWYLERDYDFNGTRIYNELVKLGYSGGINPIYRYLKILDEEKCSISRRATVRYETPPGDQAQFDWAEYETFVGGEKIKVYCFSMILAYSRSKAAICSKSQNGTCIYEAIQDLFIELGGVTKEILIDNPKALVVNHKKGEEVDFNESALKLFAYLVIDPNACLPMRPRTKGKIEKPFQYLEEQFFKGSSFDSMDDLNEKLKEFMNTWSKRINGTTKRAPIEMYEEEKKFLGPLKEKIIIDSELETRTVSTDSFVTVDTNRYSIPVKYVDKLVKVRIVYGYILEIYDFDLRLIKKYKITQGRNMKLEDKEDYKAIAQKVPSSIPEIRRVFEKTFVYGSEFYKLTSKITKQPHFHARELLKLTELYSVKDLDIILKHCIESNILKIDGVKALIKDKYLELIIEHEKLELKLKESKKDRYSLKNEKAIIRDLSYYDKGGQN